MAPLIWMLPNQLFKFQEVLPLVRKWTVFLRGPEIEESMSLLQPPQSPGILTRSQEDRGTGTSYGEETKLETGSWEIRQAVGFCLVRSERKEVGVQKTKMERGGSKGAACQHSGLGILDTSSSALPNTLASGKLPIHLLMRPFTPPTWTWHAGGIPSFSLCGWTFSTEDRGFPHSSVGGVVWGCFLQVNRSTSWGSWVQLYRLPGEGRHLISKEGLRTCSYGKEHPWPLRWQSTVWISHGLASLTVVETVPPSPRLLAGLARAKRPPHTGQEPQAYPGEWRNTFLPAPPPPHSFQQPQVQIRACATGCHSGSPCCHPVWLLSWSSRSCSPAGPPSCRGWGLKGDTTAFDLSN